MGGVRGIDTWRRNKKFRLPLPRTEIVLLSQDDMVSRIEAVRMADPDPICSACGSTAVSRIRALRRALTDVLEVAP